MPRCTRPARTGAADTAVTALYQAHALGLIRPAYLMLGDTAAAEDMVQEAFTGLYRRWAQLSDPAKALPYVRSSILNACRTQLRRLGQRPPGVGQNPPPAISAEAAALSGEDRRAVLSALRRLVAAVTVAVSAGYEDPGTLLIERTAVMSVELNPYLFFPGKAEEAINFYQQVFGGQVDITRMSDVDQNAPAGQRNLVINAQLTGGDITLRASDREDTSTEPQTRVELSLISTDEERLRTVFDALTEGGVVRTKLERQFWGDVFGAITDKYGIGWQINIGTAGN